MIESYSKYKENPDKIPEPLKKIRCLCLHPNEHESTVVSETEHILFECSVRDLINYFLGPKKVTLEHSHKTRLDICEFCGGAGKLDWARRPRGQKRMKDVLDFIPEKEPKIVCTIKEGLVVAAQFLPVLYETESYCFKCGATGMRFDKYEKTFGKKLWHENSILETIHWRDR